MSGNEGSPRPPVRSSIGRWSSGSPARRTPYRMAFRLLGIPVIAVGAVFLYRGAMTHFALPDCDSETAKQTLSEVLKQLKLEPVRYAPIKTISTSKTEVVCNATMPLPNGDSVVADYTFYWQASTTFWQGNKANMRYSVRRQPAKSSSRSAL